MENLIQKISPVSIRPQTEGEPVVVEDIGEPALEEFVGGPQKLAACKIEEPHPGTALASEDVQVRPLPAEQQRENLVVLPTRPKLSQAPILDIFPDPPKSPRTIVPNLPMGYYDAKAIPEHQEIPVQGASQQKESGLKLTIKEEIEEKTQSIAGDEKARVETKQQKESSDYFSNRLLSLENNFGDDVDENFLGEKTPEEKELYKAASQEAKAIGEDRRRFWNMLVTEIPKSKFTLPEGRNVRILNVGCGGATEAFVLRSYFGGEEWGNETDKADFFGIDINPKEIEKARRRYQRLDVKTFKRSPEPGYTFVTGDATQLDNYTEIPSVVDIVVVRHQKISDNREGVWTNIFKQARERLSGKGILITTSFSDIEHQILERELPKIGFEIVISEKNPYAKPLPREEICVDRRVLIARKV